MKDSPCWHPAVVTNLRLGMFATDGIHAHAQNVRVNAEDSSTLIYVDRLFLWRVPTELCLVFVCAAIMQCPSIRRKALSVHHKSVHHR